MKKKPSPLFPIVAMLVGAAVLASVVHYVKDSPAASVPPERHRSQEDPAQGLRSPDKVTVYRPRYEGDDLVFDKTTKATKEEDPKVFALNEYLKSLPMVPKEARVRSVKVKAGVATVDFTAAFATTYGTEDEQTVVKGLLTTLGQFEDVNEAVLTVEGRPLDTLGHLDLAGPQKVMRAGQTPPEESGR
jgi:spore germination protein GerM